jgi:hypothetical protein
MELSAPMLRCQSGFYWPTMYDDAKSFVRRYNIC